MMAGRDASRALALISLDVKDIENNRIDDLSAMDIQTLDEWRFKFHSKYTCMGTLKGWTSIGSPLPKALSHTVKENTTTNNNNNNNNNTSSVIIANKENESFLTKERQRVILKEKIQLSPDTFLFRFSLPKQDMILGLPIGKHIKFFCPNPSSKIPNEWNGRPDPEAGKTEIERKYTPSTLDSELDGIGQFSVVIKVYKPNDKFCDGGKMSQHMGNLKIGEALDVCGPFGLIEYKGNGNFIIQKKSHQASFFRFNGWWHWSYSNVTIIKSNFK